MATTTHPTAKTRPPTRSMRTTALVAGVLYLITIVASIPAQFVLYHPVFSDPEYVLGAGADTRVLWGGFLELITALACIGTAVVLYPVVRRHGEAIALGFVTARVFEAALIAVGIVSVLSVVTLRQPGVGGTEATALVTTAQALVAIHDWTFLLGPGVLPGINALLLGYLIYRSGLVPRIIPTLGLIGAPLFLAVSMATLVGINEQISVWTATATLPIFAWELSLGLWLALKGFNPDTFAARRRSRKSSEASSPPQVQELERVRPSGHSPGGLMLGGSAESASGPEGGMLGGDFSRSGPSE